MKGHSGEEKRVLRGSGARSGNFMGDGGIVGGRGEAWC